MRAQQIWQVQTQKAQEDLHQKASAWAPKVFHVNSACLAQATQWVSAPGTSWDPQLSWQSQQAANAKTNRDFHHTTLHHNLQG